MILRKAIRHSNPRTMGFFLQNTRIINYFYILTLTMGIMSTQNLFSMRAPSAPPHPSPAPITTLSTLLHQASIHAQTLLRTLVGLSHAHPSSLSPATPMPVGVSTSDSIDTIMREALAKATLLTVPTIDRSPTISDRLLTQTLLDKYRRESPGVPISLSTQEASERLVNQAIAHDVFASRSIGALMGNVIGDAVGAPVEFLDTQSANPYAYLQLTHDKTLNYTGRKSRQWTKPGQWTDDSSMALCLADSLIVSKASPLTSTRTTSKDYDGSDCRTRYCKWWHEGYNNAFFFDDKRRSIGLGGNIGKSLEAIMGAHAGQSYDHVPATYTAKSNDAGNGSIMRNGPVAIRFATVPNKGIHAAIQQSLGTHPGLEAAACCAGLTYITSKAIRRPDGDARDPHVFLEETIREFLDEINKPQFNGPEFTKLKALLMAPPHAAKALPRAALPTEKEAVWNWRVSRLQIEETLTARGSRYNKYDVTPGYFGSYCMDGLAMALWAFNGARSFEEAIIRCINLGGDADSTAAICGQMAGAFFGYSAMKESPVASRMIRDVQQWDPYHEIQLRALMLYHLSKRDATDINILTDPEILSILRRYPVLK